MRTNYGGWWHLTLAVVLSVSVVACADRDASINPPNAQRSPAGRPLSNDRSLTAQTAQYHGLPKGFTKEKARTRIVGKRDADGKCKYDEWKNAYPTLAFLAGEEDVTTCERVIYHGDWGKALEAQTAELERDSVFIRNGSVRVRPARKTSGRLGIGK